MIKLIQVIYHYHKFQKEIEKKPELEKSINNIEKEIEKAKIIVKKKEISNEDKFYSPLVKSIAKKEGISFEELNTIKGTGKNNRVTKNDILRYVDNKVNSEKELSTETEVIHQDLQKNQTISPINNEGGADIIEMSRMRKLIADQKINKN